MTRRRKRSRVSACGLQVDRAHRVAQHAQGADGEPDEDGQDDRRARDPAGVGCEDGGRHGRGP